MKKSFKLAGLLAGVLVLGASVPVFATGTDTSSSPQEVVSNLNITKGTMVSNLSLYSTDVTGMTLEEAQNYFQNYTNGIFNTAITASYADHIYGYTMADLGTTWDQAAFNAQLAEYELQGNVLERYKFAKDVEREKVTLDLHMTYNAETVAAQLHHSFSPFETSASNATISYITGSIVVTPSVSGISFDYATAGQLFVETFTQDPITESYALELHVTEVTPAITTEKANSFSLIGSYSTPYNNSAENANRTQNLITSTSHLTGRYFAPGETISALDLYGPMTADNGYLTAGTYVPGGAQDQLGGGICQTTTTMYNAVLLAELDIVYRAPHSKLVDYVDPSKDAMVYAQAGYDFKFANSSSDYIVLEGYVSGDHVFINIFGHEDHAPDHSVRYESVIESCETPAPNLIVTSSLPIGWARIEDKFIMDPENSGASCHAAVTSKLIKITTDNGVETQTVVNPHDVYKGESDTIAVSRDIMITQEYSLATHSVVSYFYFLDGSTRVDFIPPSGWTGSDLAAFNSTMQTRARERGFTWPDSGNYYTSAVVGAHSIVDGSNMAPPIRSSSSTSSTTSATLAASEDTTSAPEVSEAEVAAVASPEVSSESAGEASSEVVAESNAE